MIWTVAANALWIAGLSVLVAVLGDAYADARRHRRGLRVVLQRPSYAVASRLAIGISCIGWGVTQTVWLAAEAAWIIVGVWFVLGSYLSARAGRPRRSR